MVMKVYRSTTAGNVPASLADGQLAINEADEVLFYKNAGGTIQPVPLLKLARIGWTPRGDAAYQMLATDRSVALTATLTAPRTFTLPAANSVAAGTSVRLVDVKGGVSATNSLTLAGSGSDTLNGAASVTFTSPFIDFLMTSDGSSTWTAGITSLARGGTGVAASSAADLLSKIGAQPALGFTPENAANKGQASGYAQLGADGKLPNSIIPSALLTALEFNTTWDASANSPALASGVGTKGQIYVIATAGTTALDGIAQWNVGDWAIFDGAKWRKVDGLATEVISVAGLVGAVTAAALKTALAIAADDVSGLGGAATRAVGTTAGTVAAGDDSRFSAAAAGFPISGVSAKSAAYTIGSTAGDLGKLFDITGSIPLTLPAASGGSAAAPLYYHFRKRDGSGRATVVPNGTDTIEGANAAIALYQERATLVSFGSGWIFPPGGRERTVYVVPPKTNLSAVSSLALTFDPDVADVEIALSSLVPSSSSAVTLLAQVVQNGAYVTGNSYPWAQIDHGTGSASEAGGYNNTAWSVGPQANFTSSNAATLTLTLRDIISTAGRACQMKSEGFLNSATTSQVEGFISQGSAPSSGYAVTGVKIYPSSGTMTGNYSLKVTRS